MEKAPKKKARRPLRGRMVLALLLCACAVVGGGVVLVRSLPHGLPVPEERETIMLLARPAEEIASVVIAPRDSAAYPLLRKEDGFVLQGREEAPLRASVMEEITLSLGKVPAEALVLTGLNPTQGLTKAAFGLEPPQARISITYQDGETKELLLGDLAPDEERPQRYCMVAGDEALYTMLEADSTVFFHEMEYLLDFDQPSIDTSLLDRIEVTGGVVWQADYTPSGWQMEQPFRYPLSLQRMESLLGRVGSMGFEALLGDEDSVDLAALGLDSPEVTVKLTQAATVISGETEEGQQVSFPVDERVYLLKLGRDTGKSGVYLSWEGQVFKASNFLLGFWKTLNPRDLVLLNPVNLPVYDLDTVRLSTPGIDEAYHVRMVESIAENNRIATDEYGQTLYDMAVRRADESEDMNAEAFAAWYTMLASLSGDGTLPEGFALSGESRATVTLTNSHLTRTVSFYPYDALHDAIAVDGVALFYIQKERVDQILSTIP